MPFAFINGGTPDCAGQIITGAVDMITRARDCLIAAGWTVSAGTPEALPLRMESGFAVGGRRAYCEFANNAGNVDLRGVHDSAGTTPSTNRTIRADLSGNRLWMGADERSFVIHGSNNSAGNAAKVFGWVELVDPFDEWGWICGDLTDVGTGALLQIARIHAGTGVWQSSIAAGGGGGGTFIGNPLTQASLNASQNDVNLTAGSRPQLQAYNRNFESGHFRGLYRHVVAGMARTGSLAQGQVYTLTDSLGTRRYLAAGDAATSRAGLLVANS